MALSAFGLLAKDLRLLSRPNILGNIDNFTFWMIGPGLLGLLIGATGLAIKLDAQKSELPIIYSPFATLNSMTENARTRSRSLASELRSEVRLNILVSKTLRKTGGGNLLQTNT